MIKKELNRCHDLLSEGYDFWDSLGFPPLNEAEREEIPNLVFASTNCEHVASLAAACQSFFLFRTLHNQMQQGSDKAILLGDYFFGIFSQCLIPLDNTQIIDEFAVFLRGDTQEGVRGSTSFDKEAYCQFVKRMSAGLKL